jgi:hypothetical protein
MGIRDFKGTNSESSTKRLFTERAQYRNYAIPVAYARKHPDLFRDFWFIENMYYGRIDMEHRSLTPKEEFLVPAEGNQGKSVFVFDFVAEAFSDFLRDHKKAAASGKLRKDDDFLFDITAINGYKNPLHEYDLHMTSVRNDVQRVLFRNHKRVEDFKDFVDYFLEFVFLRKEESPLTLTGFMSSRFSSPLMTGLFIDISSLDYSEDFDKVDKFFDSPNFPFFMKNCLKHGFMIDKNIPWRICANLGSLEMSRYMLKYDLSLDNIFTNYYDKSYFNDIDYLVRYMAKFYNRFVSYKPFVRKEALRDGEIHRYVQRRTREKIKTIDDRYDSEFKIDFYCDLRNWETKQRYDESHLERIKRNALEYEKINGLDPAYDYIDRQFKGFLNDTGAYNAYIIRQEARREKSQITGQEIEGLLRDSVAESRKTFY